MKPLDCHTFHENKTATLLVYFWPNTRGWLS